MDSSSYTASVASSAAASTFATSASASAMESKSYPKVLGSFILKQE